MPVTVKCEEFGVASKTAVHLYRLRSSAGLEVAVCTWGATTVSVCAPDRNGLVQDVTLNHPDLASIQEQDNYYGATIGRVASTISGARYKLGNKEFKLSANINGQHHAHGGFRGFDKQVWQAEVLPSSSAEEASVCFCYTSIDGEEGYAGTLTARVTYTVTATNELVLEYWATTDKPTPINLTNHTYWNLSGDCAEDILSQRLVIHSSQMQQSPMESAKLTPTSGTPYDFRSDKQHGERIGSRIKDTPEGIGYDNVYVLDATPNAAESADAAGRAAKSDANRVEDGGTASDTPNTFAGGDGAWTGSSAMRPAARLVDETSGRVMEVLTNQVSRIEAHPRVLFSLI